MSRFISANRHKQYLQLSLIDEWLPDKHSARFNVEVIDQLELSRPTSRYKDCGFAAYHPSLLLSLLVYGYATGIFFGYKIEYTKTQCSMDFNMKKTEHRDVMITLSETHRSQLNEIANTFAKQGLNNVQKLESIGVITGDASQHLIDILKRTAGVAAIEFSDDVQIAPPNSEIQEE